ncbi:MAG: HDIG domain-containing protein [Chloroflexi bacterium]|nr:HDIG domain-containing protein [Chloroflexota bacterium]
MKREDCLQSIARNVKNGNLVKHMLATEAIMRCLARRFGQDEDRWGLAGLLHDVDVEITGSDMTKHSKVGGEMSKELGADEEMAAAIVAHNEAHGVPRDSLMAKALFAADPLTGFLTAVALVRLDKKLASVEVRSALKRLPEKRFAAGANRDQMATSRELGMALEDFVRLGLEAMQAIAPDLGL